MTKYSVKKPFTVLVGVVMIIVLGFISFSKITTDLLPGINFPYVMAVTTYSGASPEKVESSVTSVVERSLGKVTKVKNVSSVSSENTSMVLVEFEEDTDMDSALVKLSTACEQLREYLPEEAGSPVLLEMSPDMMPTMTVGIDYEGKDIKDLSRFTEEELLPYIERKEGVASAVATGEAVERVEIKLSDTKIDRLNDKILGKVDSQFNKARKVLDEKEQEITKASAELEKSTADLEKNEKEKTEELAKYSAELDEAVATLKAYEVSLESLKTSKKALEAEKKAYEEKVLPGYNQLNEMLEPYHTDVKSLAEDRETFNKIRAVLEGASAADSDNRELAGLLKSFTWENLVEMNDAVNVRIPEINSELANLRTEIAAAEATVNALETQIESARNNYALVEEGKMTASAAFAAAKSSAGAGKDKLASAQTELNKAKDEYNQSRKSALENAGLDKLVNKKTLSQLIYAQNFEMPAGYLQDKENKVLLKIGDNFDSLKELENTVLGHFEGVGTIRVKDVCNVGITDNSEDSYAKIGGNDAVILNITKSSVAGTSAVSKTLNSTIEELENKYEGLHFTVLMDQGAYIKLIIDAVVKNLLMGALLAILVLALFLKDIKPTIVVAFSIPLSVLFAIVLMYFSGITVNLISLSGLALGVGMLVDNSIVVIENIYRLRHQGIPAPKAAVMGAKQVAGAIFASTLTTICVFLPILFVDGMTRELFTDMGLTMAYSLLASLVIALTFVPSMSATVLKKEITAKHRLFDRMVENYEKVLAFCLRRKIVPIGIALILLVISVMGAGRMGMEMLPEMSGGYISVSVKLDDRKDQNEIYEKVDELTEEILKMEGVETVGAMSGNGMFMENNTGKKKSEFSFYVQLEEDKTELDSTVAKAIEKAGEKDKSVVEISASDSNMDMSALGETGLQIRIEGSDLDLMAETGEDVKALMGKVKGFKEITTDQEEGEKAVRLVLDRDKLMKKGITVAELYGMISDALKTEEPAVTLTLDNKDYQVVIVDKTDLLTKSNILDYEIEKESPDGKGGTTVKKYSLSQFAELESAAGISSIHRENQARFLTVKGEPEEGENTALLSRKVEKLLQDYEAPEGITVELSGEVMNIHDMMIDMFKMIALAIAFIYMIMVAQFQSLLSPFIVLFTIPLAFTGGLLALWISGEPVSTIAMMGFLVLAGVVVNNGIVFVDYVNQMRLGGMDKITALKETGKARMRPILMTAMTTILAMSTMIFSREIAAEMSRGMAIVTIGGLAYATLMTLFIVPVLYDLLFRRTLKNIDVETE